VLVSQLVQQRAATESGTNDEDIDIEIVNVVILLGGRIYGVLVL